MDVCSVESAENHCEERPAFTAVLALEVRSGKFALVGGPGAFERLPFEQVCHAVCVLTHPLEVVLMVGCKSYEAVGLQRAVDLAEKRFLDESAFVVAFLGPGIWEVHMDLAKAAVRGVAANEKLCVNTDEPDVLQPVPAATIGGMAPERSGVFQPDVVDLRGLACLLDKERALARAYLQFERTVGGAGEPAGQIDRALVERRQLRLVQAEVAYI